MAATLSMPQTLSPTLPPLNPTPRCRRPPPPSASVESERGVSFDPGDAFYRRASAAGRDLGVLAAAVRGRPSSASGPLCLDAMCGCGVRALRYLAQAGAAFVWANDASEALRPLILSNLAACDSSGDRRSRRWVVSHVHASRLLAERYLRREYFDVIDVDSFGSDSLYIRAAFLALKIGGLLYLTSTDWRSARGYGGSWWCCTGSSYFRVPHNTGFLILCSSWSCLSSDGTTIRWKGRWYQ